MSRNALKPIPLDDPYQLDDAQRARVERREPKPREAPKTPKPKNRAKIQKVQVAGPVQLVAGRIPASLAAQVRISVARLKVHDPEIRAQDLLGALLWQHASAPSDKEMEQLVELVETYRSQALNESTEAR